MSTIGAYDAKTHLPRLLDEVEKGASFVITRHGRPVARLLGMRGGRGGAEATVAFAQARQGIRLGMPLRDAIAEGRR